MPKKRSRALMQSESVQMHRQSAGSREIFRHRVFSLLIFLFICIDYNKNNAYSQYIILIVYLFPGEISIE